VQTPVPKVGRLTIERIELHGSLGGLGDGETLGPGGALGAAPACARAEVLPATIVAPIKKAVAMTLFGFTAS
jgi:hypothetical protein